MKRSSAGCFGRREWHLWGEGKNWQFENCLREMIDYDLNFRVGFLSGSDHLSVRQQDISERFTTRKLIFLSPVCVQAWLEMLAV